MEPKEKRPRIRPETAAIIDSIRKGESFESFVDDALGVYLEVFWDLRLRRGWKSAEGLEHKWTGRIAERHEILINLLSGDWFQFDGDDFRAAFERAMEYHAARMDEFARDEENEV